MRRSNPPRSAGGPLMTEHLQLQDLDLELELLKRKREMIEQQQQMLTTNQPFNRPSPFDYGNKQPRPLFPEHQSRPQPFGNSAGFSRYYNEPQGGGGLLGKRPMHDPPVWQAQSAPKRFSEMPKRKFGANPNPKLNNGPRQQWDNKPKPYGGPKPNFPSQKFNYLPKGSKPQQKDFRPNKVTKGKPQPGNKLASYPTPERKKLVQQATKSSKEEYSGEQYVLKPDVVPPPPVVGRLELALGNILKEIKLVYADTEPHSASFQSQFLTRKMKQAIRERLRGIMLNKAVGKVGVIVDHYRKVFPPATDSEILEIALAEKQNLITKKLAIKLEPADSAFKYLKNNFNRLVGVTLDDVFEKLQKMYAELEEDKAKEICDNIIAEAIDFTKDIEAEAGNDSTEAVKEEGDEKKEEGGENKEEGGENKEEGGENKEKGGENKEQIVDAKVENGEAMETNENQPENVEETATGEDASVKKADEVTDDEKPAQEEGPAKNNGATENPLSKKLDDMIVGLIKRRLPYMLPKFKPQLMKVLHAVGSFQVTKTAIVDKTQELLNLENRIETVTKGLNNSNAADQTIDLSSDELYVSAVTSTPNRARSIKFSYMVKIHGRPALPKRKIMQTFLDEYKPASVKKHRNMPLLFVGFTDKESYDNIVAVKETSLGNCTIHIKASENTAPKTNDSLNNSTDKIISADLDEQINDLLSSIRKEEENSHQEGEDGDAETVADVEVPSGDGNNDASNENNDVKAEGVENEAEETENGAEGTENGTEVNENENAEANDKLEALKTDAKETGRATPTRASSRIANGTPSSVRTRRASRLAQN